MFMYEAERSLADANAKLDQVSKEIADRVEKLQQALAGSGDSVAADSLVHLANSAQHLQATRAVLAGFERFDAALAEKDLSSSEVALRRYRYLLDISLNAHRSDDYSGRNNDGNRAYNDGIRETVHALRTYVDALASLDADRA